MWPPTTPSGASACASSWTSLLVRAAGALRRTPSTHSTTQYAACFRRGQKPVMVLQTVTQGVNQYLVPVGEVQGARPLHVRGPCGAEAKARHLACS